MIKDVLLLIFHDGGPYHIKASSLICSANQWTGFYMVGTSVKKELRGIRQLYKSWEVWYQAYLISCQTSMTKLSCENY